MNRARHTNVHNSIHSGIYVDDTNQMVLFDTNELPLLVNPSKYTNSTSKKIKREIVRNWIARYVK